MGQPFQGRLDVLTFFAQSQHPVGPLQSPDFIGPHRLTETARHRLTQQPAALACLGIDEHPVWKRPGVAQHPGVGRGIANLQTGCPACLGMQGTCLHASRPQKTTAFSNRRAGRQIGAIAAPVPFQIQALQQLGIEGRALPQPEVGREGMPRKTPLLPIPQPDRRHHGPDPFPQPDAGPEVTPDNGPGLGGQAALPRNTAVAELADQQHRAPLVNGSAIEADQPIHVPGRMLGLAMDRQGLPKALQRRESIRCNRVMVNLALPAGRRRG